MKDLGGMSYRQFTNGAGGTTRTTSLGGLRTCATGQEPWVHAYAGLYLRGWSLAEENEFHCVCTAKGSLYRATVVKVRLHRFGEGEIRKVLF